MLIMSFARADSNLQDPISNPPGKNIYLGVRQGLQIPNQNLVIQYSLGFFVERELQRPGRMTRIFGLGYQRGSQLLETGHRMIQTYLGADGRFELGYRFFLGLRSGLVFKTLAYPDATDQSRTTSGFFLGPVFTFEPKISWPTHWKGFLRSMVDYTIFGIELSAVAQTGMPVITSFNTLIYIKGRIW